MTRPKVNLDSVDTYLESSMNILKHKLKEFFGDYSKLSVKEINDKLNEVNSYRNLKHLEDLDNDKLVILDEDKISTKKAEDIVLNGEFFWEHTAAGEATRLGLGPKYLLQMSKMSESDVLSLIKKESGKDVKLSEIGLNCNPQELLPLSFGARHMLQKVYDVTNLANKKGLDVADALGKQQMLIILNENSGGKIIDEFIMYDFFGLNRRNVFFMIQHSFHGIVLKEGELKYDLTSDKRLHNHGQMFMQKLHEGSVFYINRNNERKHLSYEKYHNILQEQKLMLSYNIEDIGYLTNSLDLKSLALANELSEDGYEMIMEIVKQNPIKPQKGGAAFFDPKLGKICMIESNRLADIKNEDIKHLNKNFNIYPNPSKVLERLKEDGLAMPFDIKKTSSGDYHIYFCPVQGDINFLMKTAFVIRKKPKSISNLKSPATLPATINAMCEQDNQPGFKELACRLVLNK